MLAAPPAGAQPYEMRCSADSKACSRRRTVASLLVFAKELEKAGRISKASKGLLKGEWLAYLTAAAASSIDWILYHSVFTGQLLFGLWQNGLDSRRLCTVKGYSSSFRLLYQ